MHALKENIITRPSPAMDHPKTPRSVIVMENCHRLDAILRGLKTAHKGAKEGGQGLQGLEDYRKIFRKAYEDAEVEYVTSSMGRPLEKLNVSLFSSRMNE